MYKNQKLNYEDKVHIAKDIVEHGLAADNDVTSRAN